MPRGPIEKSLNTIASPTFTGSSTFTGPAYFADGTAAAPSITFASTPTAGWLWDPSNGLSASIGGTRRLSIYNGGFSLAGHILLAADNTYDIGASGATRPRSIYVGTSVLAAGPTGGVGYTTGAGGTVTQITSKSTGVTLNTVTGNITTTADALAADAAVSFTLTDSAIAATDLVAVSHHSGGTAGAYTLTAQAAAGSAVITIRNVTAGALSEALVIKFAVIKGATA